MKRTSLAVVVSVPLLGVLGATLAAERTGTPAAAQSLYFPNASGPWETVSPQSAGWDSHALDDALAYAQQMNSSGVVIAYNGRILAERYWQPAAARRVASTSEGWAIEDVASLQKSVISLMVGIAVEHGLVDRNAPVSKYLGAGWSKAPADHEASITINHLLTMTSGLTESLQFEAAAGTRWFYNTPAYSRLISALASVTHKEPNDYTAEWLTRRLGMTDTRWIKREGAGSPVNLVNPYGLATTARDLARVGILVLSGGMWKGDRIINESYVREMVQPSQRLNPSYGLLWYANRPVPPGMQRQPHLSLPVAPADMVAGQGAGERRIYVVLSQRLVVTRLGAPAPALDAELWARLMKAVPKPTDAPAADDQRRDR
jgi:CubicO group peptidase (beta-lactamase class C family)